jgi:taurine dioxygenase
MASSIDKLSELEVPEGVVLDHYSPAIGTEVKGIDLRQPLSDEVAGFLRRLWLKRKVIFFHGQELTPDQHIALGRRFGALEQFPPDPRTSLQGYPELLIFRRGAGNTQRENVFHADLPFCDPPVAGTLVQLRECPEHGGDTIFVNMAAAYQGLSEWLKRAIEGLKAEHRFDVITKYYNTAISRERVDKLMAQFPPNTLPIVQTHPETGEKILYVSIGYTSEIVGLPRDESFTLLKLLSDKAQVPEYQCRFRWRKNSIAMWDNRAIQHYACFDYGEQYRELHRVVVLDHRKWPQAEDVTHSRRLVQRIN